MKYQIKNTVFGEQLCRFNDNGSVSHIPMHPDNTDYQQYLAWLAEGNQPQPAEEQ